ncbi:STN and carboxypeptidase regulatory-like domain-containing protein [Pedobacter sp. UYP1]|uniref:STN and carboxypeptidase regulatory-like domain-containing protein n=1 Tax=Pedobacter sp. UYP1 TaxID=1756396 RepID=UPI0033943A8F
MNRKLLLLCFLSLITCKIYAQQDAENLSRRVTIKVKNQKIAEVLTQISTSGNFYFSYQGNLFNTDSLVNVSVRNTPVRTILDQLFRGKIDYKENGQHIILRSANLRLTIEPDNITTAERLYLISGYVIDTKTGAKVKQASVYEKRLLQSTLTNNDGYFKLRFKGDYNEVILTASKEAYRDTTLIFLSNITIKPQGYEDTSSTRKSKVSNLVENMGIGRFFVSSRQRLQSLNLSGFLANSPFQASLTPGLSSHGMMSSQVINKASFNILGGYSAGLDGLEMAGLFNMDKTDVGMIQIAGLFNIVGGSVKGLQMAGAVNSVIGNVDGMQAGGLVNSVRGHTTGLQMAGVMNLVKGDLHGFQAAGLYNYTRKDFNGLQMAGAVNIANGTLKGAQIAGLFNYAKNVKGVQFGLVNVADSSSGYSIGLINIVKKNGYHKISLSSNELINANLSIKTGTKKLYTILMAGRNISDTAKISSVGFGFGHEIQLNEKLAIGAEYLSQFISTGKWSESSNLNKLQLNLQYKIAKGLAIFGGPSYSIYGTDHPQGSGVKGFKQQIPPSYAHAFNNTTSGWLGWNIGITLF